MKSFRAAGLVYGDQEHHLDHIAPLAILMRIPLIVTETHLEEIAAKYYPDLEVLYFDYVEIGQKAVQEYDVIFSSLPKDLFDQIFFIAESLNQKKLLSVWCPHGNSDKGHASFFMEGLSKEKIALVYGQKMIDFLVEKKAFSGIGTTVTVGNYRYRFYKEHALFYDQIVHREILKKLRKGKKTILYAPTWNDAENSSSFDAALPTLLKNLPDTWNLIIKPHPNTLHEIDNYPLLENKKNLLLLKNFPIIYPLLNHADVYLGDLSSIGYDFLTFKKPMFFLNDVNKDPALDKGLYLYRCGTVIDPKDYENTFSIIENSSHSPYKKIQEEVYGYVFGNSNNIKEKIRASYDKIPL